MPRRTTLFLVCAFEVVLILFFLAWSAFASTEYKSRGFAEVEKCVVAISQGFVIERDDYTMREVWLTTDVTAFFEDKMYSFSYQRDGSEHYASCLVYTAQD